MDREQKLRELSRLESEAARIRAELVTDLGGTGPIGRYYTIFHVMTGLLLGFAGGCVSLLANVVGATVLGKHPLELIRVYLTFPMGADALTTSNGFILGTGCHLYVLTSAGVGVVVHLILSRFFAAAPAGRRFGVATALGIAVWLTSFYGVLSWLQPALFGGRWIVDLVPAWVAALTHLSLVWTIFVLDELGAFASPLAHAAVPQPATPEPAPAP